MSYYSPRQSDPRRHSYYPPAPTYYPSRQATNVGRNRLFVWLFLAFGVVIAVAVLAALSGGDKDVNSDPGSSSEPECRTHLYGDGQNSITSCDGEVSSDSNGNSFSSDG